MLPVNLLRIILILTFLLGLSASVAGVLAVWTHRRRSLSQAPQQTTDD